MSSKSDAPKEKQSPLENLIKKTGMMKVSDFVADSIQKIEVGQYEIRKLRDGSFWIEHETGEGMQVKADSLEALITQYYADNF